MERGKLLKRGVAIGLARLLLAGTLTTAGVVYSSADNAAEGGSAANSVKLPAEYFKGDLNGDDQVDITDVMAACRVLARQHTNAEEDPGIVWACDVTGDNANNIQDVMQMCRMLASGQGPIRVLRPSDPLEAGKPVSYTHLDVYKRQL